MSIYVIVHLLIFLLLDYTAFFVTFFSFNIKYDNSNNFYYYKSIFKKCEERSIFNIVLYSFRT